MAGAPRAENDDRARGAFSSDLLGRLLTRGVTGADELVGLSLVSAVVVLGEEQIRFRRVALLVISQG